jgi:hypothetical protein
MRLRSFCISASCAREAANAYGMGWDGMPEADGWMDGCTDAGMEGGKVKIEAGRLMELNAGK